MGEMSGKQNGRGSQVGRVFKLPGSSNTYRRRDGRRVYIGRTSDFRENWRKISTKPMKSP